mmetsp:Transcript_6842/g.16534  ORF Transcript_6842/g.16534 Transcript_6842/m.16534 type:complete len:148 (+) Transcript_6842:372-815(+)
MKLRPYPPEKPLDKTLISHVLRKTSNDFQVKMWTEVANQHNDKHVLENHSLSKGMSLLRLPQYNFIEKWRWEDQQAFRKDVIDMVLATDMSQHFDVIGDFVSKFAIHKQPRTWDNTRESIDFWTLDKSSQTVCLQMALKVGAQKCGC